MKKSPARIAALVGVLVALAMILSYIESLVPAFIAVPGVKLGLANSVGVFALYFLGWQYAAGISLVRVLLSSLLFGSPVSLIYSLSGALLSLLGMVIIKRLPLFSTVGVSTVGGVLHNMGQTAAACIVIGSGAIFYLPMLIISGVAAGVVIGVISGIILARMEKHRGTFGL